MPLLFTISDADEVIYQIHSPEIRAIHALCKSDERGLIRTADILPHINEFSGVWMTLQPFQGNWFCLRSCEVNQWIGSSFVSGRFLTEFQNADLHRFYPVLEAVRKNNRNLIVRHCIAKDGKITFWETLVLISRYHDLLDEYLYIIVSKQHDLARQAVRELFVTSPIALLVILPLRDGEDNLFDAYIVEANCRARALLQDTTSEPEGMRFREQLAPFLQDEAWQSFENAAEQSVEMVISLNGQSYSLHIQKMNVYWVIHLIPMESEPALGTVFGYSPA